MKKLVMGNIVMTPEGMALMELVMRRDAASKLQPLCPKCGTEQVQLLGWVQWPVLFRCRHCKHKFNVAEDGTRSNIGEFI